MIGIVTQPLGYNYGGILQNFALQNTLKKLGFDSITIDDTYRYSKLRYCTSYMLSLFLNVLGKKRQYPPQPYKGRNIPKKTGAFIFKYIRISRPYEGFSAKTINKYGIDTLIVGSDQVWRPAYNKSLYNMYLDFAPPDCRRISYAASFGTHLWEYNAEETIKCKHLLQSFAAVSVREKSGVELIKKHLDYKDAKLVLDPTLLLDKADYLSLCEAIGKVKTHYLCAYILDMTDEKVSFIHSVAKKKGLEVRLFSAHDNLMLSVEEWLCNFRDASFVITDSFHGTVFSIIFERDFFVLPNEERGKNRFLSLLSALGLSNRIYNESGNCEETIQWNEVKYTLCVLRQDSMSYLKNIL